MDPVGITQYSISHSLHLPSSVNTLAEAASTQLTPLVNHFEFTVVYCSPNEIKINSNYYFHIDLYLHIILANCNFPLPWTQIMPVLKCVLYWHFYSSFSLLLVFRKMSVFRCIRHDLSSFFSFTCGVLVANMIWFSISAAAEAY